MAVRVAINGLGRTGRAAFRAAHERAFDIEFVALNDLMGAETLAHPLRHDTVYGRFPGTIEVGGDALVVDGVEIRVFGRRTRRRCPGTSSASRWRSSRRASSAGGPTRSSISKRARAR
jgi:glyceraldehyde 3-phosphate dehydrogenase